MSDLTSPPSGAFAPDARVTDGGTEVLDRASFVAAQTARASAARISLPPPLDDLVLDDFGDPTRLDLEPPFPLDAHAEASDAVPQADIAASDAAVSELCDLADFWNPNRPAEATSPLAVDVRPSSIAPVALDASPDSTLKYPAVEVRATKTAPARALAAKPKKSHVGAVLAAAAAAMVAIAVVGTVVVAKDASGSRNKPAVAAARTRTPQARADDGAARSVVVVSPEEVPQKAEASDEPKKKKRKRSPVSSAWLEAPEPDLPPPPPPVEAPAPPVAPAAPAPVPVPTTGVVEVPRGLKTVMIDGDYRRAAGGRVVVSCGRHKVNAGRGTQTVDVPCGGSVSAF